MRKWTARWGSCSWALRERARAATLDGCRCVYRKRTWVRYVYLVTAQSAARDRSEQDGAATHRCRTGARRARAESCGRARVDDWDDDDRRENWLAFVLVFRRAAAFRADCCETSVAVLADESHHDGKSEDESDDDVLPRRDLRRVEAAPMPSSSHVRGVQAATQCIGAFLSGHCTETVPSSLVTRMSNFWSVRSQRGAFRVTRSAS